MDEYIKKETLLSIIRQLPITDGKCYYVPKKRILKEQ